MPEPRVYLQVLTSDIPALDGIRALSVLLVILAHLGVSWASGGHGVMMFFVLSGFLITWLLLKENEQTGHVSLRLFYARRALRIFPAFYVFWLCYVVLAWAVQHRTAWPEYLAAFFYVSNYYSVIVHPSHMAMAHTWSLGVEEQFYLVWPCIFRRFRNDLARMSLFLTGVIVFVWIYRFILYGRFHDDVWLFCAFDCRADHLAIGCLTAVLLKRRAYPRLTAKLTTSPVLPLVMLSLLAISRWIEMQFGRAYEYRIGFIADPLLIDLLMVQWINISDSYGWRWLNWKPVRYLGRLSYSAYLYHWLVDYVFITRLAAIPLLLRALIAVAASNSLAFLSYQLVEVRFLKLKKRFAPTPPLVAQAGGTAA